MKSLACLVVLAACGDDGTQVKLDGGACWPLTAAIPGGQVELGTGTIAFEPIPDTFAITRNGGAQASANIPIMARIHGMPPGNPDDLFDVKNPKTKVSAVLVATGAPLGVQVPCPASLPYVASGTTGVYDMLHDLAIDLSMTLPEDVDHKQATITVEVVGSNGLYAMDQKTVTLTLPP